MTTTIHVYERASGALTLTLHLTEEESEMPGYAETVASGYEGFRYRAEVVR